MGILNRKQIEKAGEISQDSFTPESLVWLNSLTSEQRRVFNSICYMSSVSAAVQNLKIAATHYVGLMHVLARYLPPEEGGHDK